MEEKATPQPNQGEPKKKPQRATRSALVGKANPVRDLGIFLAFLGIMYLVANGFKDILEQDDPEVVGDSGISPKGKSLHELKKALKEIMDDKLKNHPPRLDCDLFLAKSSIPETGLGLFAGKNYSLGEEIVSGSKYICIYTFILMAKGRLWNGKADLPIEPG